MFYIKQKTNRGYVKNIRTIRLMNHMETGIYEAHIDITKVLKNVSTLTTKENSLMNNTQFNNFIEDFRTLDDVLVTDGVYSKSLGKISY